MADVDVSIGASFDGAAAFAFLPPDARPDWARDLPREGDTPDMTSTLGSILDRAGIGTAGIRDLDAQIQVPILTGAQRQGDVIIIPRPNMAAATTPVPAEGVAVVRGEAGGNTHRLQNWDGTVYFDAIPDGGQTGLRLGVLTVPDGASAYLCHEEEHGANGIGAGTYLLAGQREFAGEWQRVAD